jgi:hypothetical protein
VLGGRRPLRLGGASGEAVSGEEGARQWRRRIDAHSWRERKQHRSGEDTRERGVWRGHGRRKGATG